MIHLLLAMLHNMLPAKVGLGAGKFMAAGIPAKAGAMGHQMFLAQVAHGTAATTHQIFHTSLHQAGRLVHTAKGLVIAAENGLKPMANLFAMRGWVVPLQIGQAGFMSWAFATDRGR